MEKKVIFIYFIVFVLVATLMGCSGLISEKIAADLVKDMAERGYVQKVVDGKVLWVKDGK